MSDNTRLGRELAELEATDPKVAEAARRCDEMVWRLTHRDDCANPMRDE